MACHKPRWSLPQTQQPPSCLSGLLASVGCSPCTSLAHQHPFICTAGKTRRQASPGRSSRRRRSSSRRSSSNSRGRWRIMPAPAALGARQRQLPRLLVPLPRTTRERAGGGRQHRRPQLQRGCTRKGVVCLPCCLHINQNQSGLSPLSPLSLPTSPTRPIPHYSRLPPLPLPPFPC